MSSSNGCQHHFGVHMDPVEWKSRWCRVCHLCGHRNLFSKKMVKCTICRQAFAHKRCLQTMVTGSDSGSGISSVSVPVPPRCVDADAHESSNLEVEVELTSRVCVVAHPSWLTWHRVTVPVEWSGVFSILPGEDAATRTTDRINVRVEIVTTITVRGAHGDGDGYVGDGNVAQPHFDVQSESTSTMVIVPKRGFAATDEVDVDVVWVTHARVDLVDVPASAG